MHGPGNSRATRDVEAGRILEDPPSAIPKEKLDVRHPQARWSRPRNGQRSDSPMRQRSSKLYAGSNLDVRALRVLALLVSRFPRVRERPFYSGDDQESGVSGWRDILPGASRTFRAHRGNINQISNHRRRM